MNIKKYFAFNSNGSEYAIYFKYSLIIALVIYNFLYFPSIKTTDTTGAPVGFVIVVFEVFLALLMLLFKDIIAGIFIFLSISGYNFIDQTIKDFITRTVINVLVVIVSHYILYIILMRIL